MQIERLAVALRPRSPWEAVDLGFRMARVWWRPLFASWFASTLPVAVALACLLPAHPWIALIALWWLKPIFERAPLSVISRSVFGDPPGWRATLRALPAEWRRGGIYSLTLHRPTRARSFTLPIVQLEGLRWRALSARRHVLRRGVLGIASMFQFTCLLLEFSVVLSLYGAALLLVPNFDLATVWEGLGGDVASRYDWLHYGFVYLAFSAVGPFYSAGGFGLYINRRIELEGWDIELAFRRLAQRVKEGEEATGARRGPGASVAAALAIAVLAGALGAGAPPARADELLPASEARRVIDEIVHTERVSEWRLRSFGESGGVQVPGVGALLAGGLRWILLGGALLVLVYFLSKLEFRGRGSAEEQAPEPVPEAVAGLDIRPESLPADVIGAAEVHWREGQRREAMSLLYRAALACLVGRHALRVPESATEGECVERVRTEHQGPLVEDFAMLTGSWQRVAYAHEIPAEDTFSELCTRWARHLRGAEPGR
jgi:hypothetical protein